MGRENVELARTIYERFNQLGEPPWEFFHQDVEFDASNIVGFGVLKGRDQALSGLREYAAAWDEWQIVPEEFVDAGDQVLATVLDGGRLKATSAEVHNRFFNVLTFREGKVARWKTFTDRAEAAEAAGLSNGETPQENVEVARRICEAAWLRPEPDYETIASLGHPDHEMFTIQSLVEGGGYRGAEGFRRWLASWSEMFGSDWSAKVDEAVAADDERVLLTGWMSAHGRQGGVPVEQRFWVVMWVRKGRATRSEVHTDHAEALRAAGMSQ